MISISAPTYDPAGALLLPNQRLDNPYEGRRRGTVTATLDGGVSVYDAGFSIADRTLKARIPNPSKATLETLKYLVAYYSQVIVCCEIGCFSCRVDFSMNAAVLSINMRIISRLDA